MTRQFVALAPIEQPDLEDLRARKEAADRALEEAERVAKREARFAERFVNDHTHWMILNVTPVAGPIRTILATLEDQLNEIFDKDELGYSVEISLTEPDLPVPAEEARDDV